MNDNSSMIELLGVETYKLQQSLSTGKFKTQDQKDEQIVPKSLESRPTGGGKIDMEATRYKSTTVAWDRVNRQGGKVLVP